MDDDDLGRLSRGQLHTLAVCLKEIPLVDRKSPTSGANFITARDFPPLRTPASPLGGRST